MLSEVQNNFNSTSCVMFDRKVRPACYYAVVIINYLNQLVDTETLNIFSCPSLYSIFIIILPSGLKRHRPTIKVEPVVKRMYKKFCCWSLRSLTSSFDTSELR